MIKSTHHLFVLNWESFIIFPLLVWKIPALFQNDLFPKWVSLSAFSTCMYYSFSPGIVPTIFIHIDTPTYATNQSSCRNVGSGFCFYKSLMKWKLLSLAPTVWKVASKGREMVLCASLETFAWEIFAKIVKISLVSLPSLFSIGLLINAPCYLKVDSEKLELQLMG